MPSGSGIPSNSLRVQRHEVMRRTVYHQVRLQSFASTSSRMTRVAPGKSYVGQVSSGLGPAPSFRYRKQCNSVRELAKVALPTPTLLCTHTYTLLCLLPRALCPCPRKVLMCPRPSKAPCPCPTAACAKRAMTAIGMTRLAHQDHVPAAVAEEAPPPA